MALNMCVSPRGVVGRRRWRWSTLPKVRLAGPESLLEVHAINRICFDEHWSLKALQDTLSAGAELRLCSGDKAFAYLLTQDVLDETHILQIAVRPEFRGHGMASVLMRSLLEAKCEQRRMLLEVRASNVPARRLYEKLGFAQIGLRPRYYAARSGRAAEDAVVLALEMEAVDLHALS
ncbi:MAG: ribosomal-protein-alanine N-acetyltransferase [Zetaproteobacteria bacterium]|nr:MAG: ribosomal-protein-alanine N-acetyltransferase [Zetaproteobacteria bacterium]